jgi:hypothetical protein
LLDITFSSYSSVVIIRLIAPEENPFTAAQMPGGKKQNMVY